MKFSTTKLSGVLLIKPQSFEDPRGLFMETYQKDEFERNGIPVNFIQDNLSRSSKGTLRGLHYQTKPKEQAKLMRVSTGKIFDVVVDIRPRSKTFGMWTGVELSSDNMMMLFVPTGFAHGFLALEDDTEVIYKVSNIYSPEHERGLIWNDPAIGIQWPIEPDPERISPKDKKLPRLKEMAP